MSKINNVEGYAFQGTGTADDPYRPSLLHKRRKIELTFILDSVPGAWHQPEDMINWLLKNSYVESVELLPDETAPTEPDDADIIPVGHVM